MPQLIERGNPITLDLLVTNDAGESVDATDVAVSIIDAAGATVVDHAAPSAHVATGHYQYVYAVAGDAQVGAWAAKWFATVDSTIGSDEDGFTVLRQGASSSPATGSNVCQAWATHVDVPAGMLPDDALPDDVDAALLKASDVLYELSGRRFPGVCSDKIRPQAQWRAHEGLPRWWPSNQTWGFGGAYGWCSCDRGRETGCNWVHEIKLPGHPVVNASIVVMLNGTEFTDWRLDDGRFLVRVDGKGWPCCQNLIAADTEDRTFSIAYDFGRSVNTAGRDAAVLLGVSLFTEMHPDLAGRCKPPQRATVVTRQGTTVTLGDPVQMVDNGLTGIRSVDLWVASVFRGEKMRRATVLVPGHHRSARRTA